MSKGRHLHDSITYYDASVVEAFLGTGTTTQRNKSVCFGRTCSLCSDGSWAGRITAYLASEVLCCIVKSIHYVDKKARMKLDARAVSCGRGWKGLIFGDNHWSKTYVPTGTHTALGVRGTGGEEGTFVEKATVTFTKHVAKYRVSTLSELEALDITEVGEDTDVEDLCYLAAPPIHVSKARVHVCSRAIPGSNVPRTMTATSLQLHCCCPLLLNLNGFDLALQIVLVCFPLPGQRGRTCVRYRASSIHKQLHGKKGSLAEGGGSGSPAAGGGSRGGEGEGEGRSPAAGVDGGSGSGSPPAVVGGAASLGGGCSSGSPPAGGGGSGGSGGSSAAGREKQRRHPGNRRRRMRMGR